MKKLIALLLCVMMALPAFALADDDTVATEVLDEAKDATNESEGFAAADGSYAFGYDKEDWNTPVEDTRSIAMESKDGQAQLQILRMDNDKEMTADELAASTEELKAVFVGSNESIVFDDAQTGILVELPIEGATVNALQFVFTMTAQEKTANCVNYVIPMGTNVFMFQLVCIGDDFEDYLEDMALTMCSLTLV